MDHFERLIRAAGVSTLLHASYMSADAVAGWLACDRLARCYPLIDLNDVDPSEEAMRASLKAGDYWALDSASNFDQHLSSPTLKYRKDRKAAYKNCLESGALGMTPEQIPVMEYYAHEDDPDADEL
jgi:hypothetical protein